MNKVSIALEDAHVVYASPGSYDTLTWEALLPITMDSFSRPCSSYGCEDLKSLPSCTFPADPDIVSMDAIDRSPTR